MWRSLTISRISNRLTSPFNHVPLVISALKSFDGWKIKSLSGMWLSISDGFVPSLQLTIMLNRILKSHFCNQEKKNLVDISFKKFNVKFILKDIIAFRRWSRWPQAEKQRSMKVWISHSISNSRIGSIANGASFTLSNQNLKHFHRRNIPQTFPNIYPCEGELKIPSSRFSARETGMAAWNFRRFSTTHINSIMYRHFSFLGENFEKIP